MNTAEKSQASEIGLAEAAQMIAALDTPKGKPTQQNITEAAPAEAQEAEATVEQDIETAPNDESPVEESAASEGEGSDSIVDGEETQEAASENDQLVTVKIDGKTMQIPLKEAVEGYQRQSDYSRKMNTLREEQKRFERDKQSVDQERSQYSQLIGALEQQLTQLMPQEPDWAKLHKEDPVNFPLIEKQWRDYKERLGAVQAEKERLAYAASQQEQAKLKDMVAQGRKFLVERNPEWKDQNKWNEARGKIVEYGRSIGYSDSELQQAYDPRAILVLDKARRYDALMANRPKPKAGEAPKPMKAGTPVNAPKRVTEISRVKQRLAKTGSVDDAAILFGLLDSRKK